MGTLISSLNSHSVRREPVNDLWRVDKGNVVTVQ